jgi:N-acetylmannosamine-6-phosphate 2-epimerase/N-acetylmannosamine kinase
VLAIDIGGTKTMAALVTGNQLSDIVTFPTDQAAGPDAWLAAVAQHFSPARSGFSRVAAAVSGLIDEGRWSALNPATLRLPAGYALTPRLEQLFSVPAFAVNDAQAAAWGEYRYGSGRREDMVFLTISTGIGGGIVLNGRLLQGLAGHFGLLRSGSADGPVENAISGRWIASQASARGHDVTAIGVFAAANGGEAWAQQIIDASAQKIGLLCADIQLMLDPRHIVIGGGIGLAPGFLERVQAQIAGLSPRLRPEIVAAQLGAQAGLVGAANLSLESFGK